MRRKVKLNESIWSWQSWDLYYNGKLIDKVLISYQETYILLSDKYDYDLMTAKIKIFEGEKGTFGWNRDNMEQIGERIFTLRKNKSGKYDQSYEDIYYDKRRTK